MFPPADLADESGLLAVGGDLSAERLKLAYSMGIFPWFDEGLPILWHSPDPRMVLWPTELRVGRTLRKAMRKEPYTLTMDTAFADVIKACAKIPRPRQSGTWITSDMIEAYRELHRQGFAHSVEAWQGETLVGGFYGVSLGTAFFGESMFATAKDASKIAFVSAVEQFAAWGIGMIDCQVHTEHLERFGAEEIPRAQFLAELDKALRGPTRRGSWRFGQDR